MIPLMPIQNAGGMLLIPLSYGYVVIFASMRKTQKHGYKNKKVQISKLEKSYFMQLDGV